MTPLSRRRLVCLNGQLGYRFDNGWRIQLDAFNILNSHSDQITYAYGSLLKSDSLFAMCFPAFRRAGPRPRQFVRPA